eukprot:CAMPEP_0185734710 /NCGR_PEP_ID=MMETSP1171-20130828/23200_1 /TAXON_ID=374046 /ORGANISM="Helicotheca tamensis, Strain CCMP826" /LENGTH=77 /DNA_ID=CAMNT_0028404777 /DNA_START=434 /DNA_END=667 /DNA_ORIENTATION=+
MAPTKILGACVVIVGVILLNISDDGDGGEIEKYQTVVGAKESWEKSGGENAEDGLDDNIDLSHTDYGSMQKFELSDP